MSWEDERERVSIPSRERGGKFALDQPDWLVWFLMAGLCGYNYQTMGSGSQACISKPLNVSRCIPIFSAFIFKLLRTVMSCSLSPSPPLSPITLRHARIRIAVRDSPDAHVFTRFAAVSTSLSTTSTISTRSGRDFWGRNWGGERGGVGDTLGGPTHVNRG